MNCNWEYLNVQLWRVGNIILSIVSDIRDLKNFNDERKLELLIIT